MNLFQKAGSILKKDGPRELVRAGSSFVISEAGLSYQSLVLPIGIDSVVKKFKEESNKLTEISETVDFAYNFEHLGIAAKPVQDRKEITELCKILKTRKIGTLLEIGTDMGGTLFLLSRMASPKARILSINLPYSRLDARCMKYRNLLYRAFATKNQKIYLLTADSHSEKTIQKVRALTKGGIDFLFIDGDHSYEGVRKDFEMYSPLVKKGGLIGFHDITNNDTVGKYWSELKKRHRSKGIEHTKGSGFGIGLIYW